MTQIIQGNNLDSRIVRIMTDFWDDRVGFVKHMIGATPTDQQGDVLTALDKNDFVSVKSGIGIGKSTVLSWLIQHYMSCRPRPKIICTSPNKDQLRNVLWPELLKWHNQMNEFLRNLFEWRKESYVMKENDGWFAVARTASKDRPEAMRGIHENYVMRLIDEASGIIEEIFETLEGATGIKETKELMCSNPTRIDGTFYHSFGRDKEFYRNLTFCSLDSPLRSERVIERIRKKYGEDSNMWLVLVKGEFPQRSGNSYIPFDWVVDAIGREIADQSNFPKVFGIDVGDGGEDDSVIAIRQGDKFYPYHILKGKQTAEVTTYAAYLANREKPLIIFVDSIGYGKAVCDGLERLGFNVVGVNVSETMSMTDPKTYWRLRDELWGLFRNWLEMRCGCLWDNEDKDLLGEATTPKYHILDGSGKIKLQSKDDFRDDITKKRVPSTNIADAHIMTFAQPVSNYMKEVDEFWDEQNGEAVGYQPFDGEAGY